MSHLTGAPDTTVCFDDFNEELLVFLAQRFGSIAFAERVIREVRSRMDDSGILSLVGNPRVYLSSFALSLGIQFLQEEFAYTWRPASPGLGTGHDKGSIPGIQTGAR